jgi:hypothetical protein
MSRSQQAVLVKMDSTWHVKQVSSDPCMQVLVNEYLVKGK